MAENNIDMGFDHDASMVEFRAKRLRDSILTRISWYLTIIVVILPGWYIDHLASTILAVVIGAAGGLFIGYWYIKICYHLERRRSGHCTADMGMILIPYVFSMMGTLMLPMLNYTYIALAFYTVHV